MEADEDKKYIPPLSPYRKRPRLEDEVLFGSKIKCEPLPSTSFTDPQTFSENPYTFTMTEEKFMITKEEDLEKNCFDHSSNDEISDEDDVMKFEESSSESESEEQDNDDENPTIKIEPGETYPSNFVWNTTLSPTPNRIPFTGTRRMKILPNGNSPVDYFRNLLTDDFIDDIVRESNNYADFLLLTNKLPSARITHWKKPLTRDEFLVFLGLCFHTGTFRFPKLHDYWLTKAYRKGLMQIPCFSEIMSRDRYLLILQVLHFATNPRSSEPKPNDYLYKIRPVINYFNNRMGEVFSPGRDLIINKPMVLGRGHSHFRQYTPNKRNKFGLKLYILAESSGLALKFNLCSGSADEEFGGPKYTERIVNSLLQERTEKWHSLYLDDHYTSVSLTKELLENQTYMTGTLRKNRKDISADLVTKKLRKGDMVQQITTEGICIMKWQGKKEILMISSEFQGDLVKVAKTNQNKDIDVRKPNMVLSYNKNMCSSNQQSQLHSYYSCLPKSMKWYRKLAIYVFQIILLNSYLAYSQFSGNQKNFYDFRLDVIEKLVFMKHTTRSRPSELSCPLTTSQLSHFPERVPTMEGKKTSHQVQCRMCWRKLKRKVKTRYYCKGCSGEDVRIALCIKCFEDWHTDFKDFK